MGTDYKRAAMEVLTHQHLGAVAALLLERDALAEQLAAIRRAVVALRPWDETRAGWAEVREDRLMELMVLVVGEEKACG